MKAVDPIKCMQPTQKHYPGGPVAKTRSSQCRGRGFNPWSGNKIPMPQLKIQRAATKSTHN